MRGVIDVFVGQIKRDDLAAFCVNAVCVKTNFSLVLSTIKCRSPVPILARSGTGNPHARRLSVV